MKIAISVPDRIHRAADLAAKRMRVPRSRFYVQAVEAYLKQTSEEDITARLDAVYSDEPSASEPFLAKAARDTFRRNKPGWSLVSSR